MYRYDALVQEIKKDPAMVAKKYGSPIMSAGEYVYVCVCIYIYICIGVYICVCVCVSRITALLSCQQVCVHVCVCVRGVILLQGG